MVTKMGAGKVTYAVSLCAKTGRHPGALEVLGWGVRGGSGAGHPPVGRRVAYRVWGRAVGGGSGVRGGLGVWDAGIVGLDRAMGAAYFWEKSFPSVPDRRAGRRAQTALPGGFGGPAHLGRADGTDGGRPMTVGRDPRLTQTVPASTASSEAHGPARDPLEPPAPAAGGSGGSGGAGGASGGGGGGALSIPAPE